MPFRLFFVLATAVTVTACASPQSTNEATFRADDAACRNRGANPGTDAYVQCRLAIDIQRANAEANAARQR
jgi:hypothetical protein